MADEADMAAEMSSALDQARERKARALAAPEQVQNPDGTWPSPECVDCGEDIEPPRLLAGRVRCLTCQDILERRRKQYAR